MDIEALKKLLAGRGPTVLGGVFAAGGAALIAGGLSGKLVLTPEAGEGLAGAAIVLVGALLAAVKVALMAKPPEAPKP